MVAVVVGYFKGFFLISFNKNVKIENLKSNNFRKENLKLFSKITRSNSVGNVNVLSIQPLSFSPYIRHTLSYSLHHLPTVS